MKNKVEKIICIVFISIFCYSCSLNQSELEGRWKAQWRTDSSNYKNLKGMIFQMNGEFVFKDSKLTILAKGFPNCIFNTDTIQNIQFFTLNKESNTLELMNENKEKSLIYKIEKLKKDTVELSLMNDIEIMLLREKN